MDPVLKDILEVALSEFANFGLAGTRIEAIAARTKTSKRMIYYHFGSKEGLYKAVLEHAYRAVRNPSPVETSPDVTPMENLVAMAGSAFDNFCQYPDFIRLTQQENLQGAQFLQQIPSIAELNRGGVDQVAAILARGQADGSMRQGITAMDVYINFVGLCVYHISARNSYHALFGYDFASEDARARRRAAICDSVVRYVRP